MSNTTELLEKLVGFDTTSHNSNLELIGFIRGHLERHGVRHRVACDGTGQKASLHAVLGPPGPGGLALSGHVDTVPAGGSGWTGDPFSLREREGRLYGRGAVDMKGFVASCLAAVPDVLALGLARPVHLLITYDEEVDIAGARRLLADMRESGWMPASCVVGEPSGLRPVVAHKGKLVARGTVRGRAGHSSQPARGVNAVHAAARAIAWAADQADRHACCGPFEDGFDPPYTTVHVGTVSGGTVLNIIPERAEFTMEWRNIPADDARAMLDAVRRHISGVIEPAMRAVDPEAGLDLVEACWYPALSLDAAHGLVEQVQRATGTDAAGKVSFATEAGLYQEAGIATLVCGPGHIAQAHQPDEWIARGELDACDAFVRRLAHAACR